MHFPGFDADAVDWLIEERDVVGFGVDTPSMDNGPSLLFKAHVSMSKNNLYGLENVKNLGQLPPSGATVYVSPINIKEGCGAPARVIGIVAKPCAAGSGRIEGRPYSSYALAFVVYPMVIGLII